jgi:hypothetical protein
MHTPEIDVIALENQIGRAQPSVVAGNAVLIEQSTIPTRVAIVGSWRCGQAQRWPAWGCRSRTGESDESQ